jgi:hypothetical protein
VEEETADPSEEMDEDEDDELTTSPLPNNMGIAINSALMNVKPAVMGTGAAPPNPAKRNSANQPPAFPPTVLLPSVTMPVRTSPLIPALVPFSLRVLRFERVGIYDWEIKENRIFNLEQFIKTVLTDLSVSSASSAFYLLDEQRISTWINDRKLSLAKKYLMNPSLFTTLESELSEMKAVITSWNLKEDFWQLQNFLMTYYQRFVIHNNNTANNGNNNSDVAALSLFDFWSQLDEQQSSSHKPPAKSGASAQPPISSPQNLVRGFLGYEVVKYHILIIRKNLALGISSDIWCKIFHNEFISAYEEVYSMCNSSSASSQGVGGGGEVSVPFGKILIYFFPQLALLERRFGQSSQNSTNVISSGLHPSDILIKYVSHHHSASGGKPVKPSAESLDGLSESVPEMIPYQLYQTIGAYNTPALKIMTK